MSISRKSSFDTIVSPHQKARDDPLSLQFLSNPAEFRKDLGLNGLSDSAHKSFVALKPWQVAVVCFYHPFTSSIPSKVIERIDECHTAIQATLAAAQLGRVFADDVAALCDTFSQKQQSPERLNELLSKLVVTAEKGYGRSIQAHGQLMCARLGLSQISESIPLHVSKIQAEKPADTTPIYPTSFNGINTCFVTLTPPVAMESEIEETDIWKAPGTTIAWPAYSSNYLTFQNVITQLDSIATDMLLFTEQVGRCVDWWSRMKSGLETLKSSLPRIDQDELQSLHVRMSNVAEGWQGVADQFALYVHKTNSVVKDYIRSPQVVPNYSTPYHYIPPTPYIAPPRRCRRGRSMSRSRSPSYSPRRPYSPPVIIAQNSPRDPDTTVQEEKT